MHSECGTVTKIEKGRALLESSPETFCSGCQARGACAVARENRSRKIWVDDTLGVREGDRVIYSIHEKGVVLSSVVLYLVPVVMLIAGIIAGPEFLFLPRSYEGKAIVGSLLGLLGAVLFLGLFTRLTRGSEIFRPKMVELDRE
jgi:sigma-E factor negative regulatory protein RseC